jgi:hypothetical protein
VRSRLPAFHATGPGPVLTILPTIQDADTTCPKDSAARGSGTVSPWQHHVVQTNTGRRLCLDPQAAMAAARGLDINQFWRGALGPMVRSHRGNGLVAVTERPGRAGRATHS